MSLKAKETLKDYIHLEYPKSCAPDDFLGQIKRTVNGRPVSQDQIDMIVSQVLAGLELNPEDSLLDIGCGNGFLSKDLFSSCRRFVGVDFSEYLIQIAKQNFEKLPDFRFLLQDAASFVSSEPDPGQFTKVLCYGVFSYFSHEDAQSVLEGLAQRFSRVSRIFIGNLPDRDAAHRFYSPDLDFYELLDDRDSPLGIWRNRQSMAKLAKKAGWSIEFSQMPKAFYASHYRFDAILSRRGRDCSD